MHNNQGRFNRSAQPIAYRVIRTSGIKIQSTDRAYCERRAKELCISKAPHARVVAIFPR